MALYYWDYLHLDQVLAAQELRSGRGDGDGAAHDEHLFIVVHQAFELWFKQILFELDAVLGVMRQDVIASREMGTVVSGLLRIHSIQRLLLVQLDVLETMTPLDFMDFRAALVPASGFQSYQFRLIENKFGLDRRHRMNVEGQPYTAVLRADHAALVADSEAAPSLHDEVGRWLARTPFLANDSFDLLQAYRAAVDSQLELERRGIEAHPILSPEARAVQLRAFQATKAKFDPVFDPRKWASLVERGERRFSHAAFVGALFVNLYRDEPMVQLPFRLLTALVDIDEAFTTWRQRHALLAHRMIGARVGTGGTSGHTYLEEAARRHRVFVDLFDLPTFFIPRSALPPLPPSLLEELDFRLGR